MDASLTESLLWDETEEGIVTLTFNRPDDLNPIGLDMLDELGAAIDRVGNDDRYRVLILTGAGRAFSAGADVKKFNDGMFREEDEPPLFFRVQGRPDIVAKIEQFPKPVIAAINGVAVGEGLEIALAADFRIASVRARLGFPEGKIGLIPASGGCSRIVRHVGLMRAKELYLGGELLGAEEAFRLGLVTKVVVHEELIEQAFALSRKLAAKAPLALAACKAVLNACADTDMHSGHMLEVMTQTVLLATKDHAEGVCAFVEKREPKFVGG